jgi:hypothetical protein
MARKKMPQAAKVLGGNMCSVALVAHGRFGFLAAILPVR